MDAQPPRHRGHGHERRSRSRSRSREHRRSREWQECRERRSRSRDERRRSRSRSRSRSAERRHDGRERRRRSRSRSGGARGRRRRWSWSPGPEGRRGRAGPGWAAQQWAATAAPPPHPAYAQRSAWHGARAAQPLLPPPPPPLQQEDEHAWRAAVAAEREARQHEVVVTAHLAGLGFGLRHVLSRWPERLADDVLDQALPRFVRATPARHDPPGMAAWMAERAHEEHESRLQQHARWRELSAANPLLRYVLHGAGAPAAALADCMSRQAPRARRLATLLRSALALQLAVPARLVETLRSSLAQFAANSDDFAALVYRRDRRVPRHDGARVGRWYLALPSPLSTRQTLESDAEPVWQFGTEGVLMGFFVDCQDLARFVFRGPPHGVRDAAWLGQHLLHPGRRTLRPPWVAQWTHEAHLYICSDAFIEAVQVALHAPQIRALPQLVILTIMNLACQAAPHSAAQARQRRRRP